MGRVLAWSSFCGDVPNGGNWVHSRKTIIMLYSSISMSSSNWSGLASVVCCLDNDRLPCKTHCKSLGCVRCVLLKVGLCLLGLA